MAYDRGNKVCVRGNKMYVGGTVSANDWKQNFTMLKTGQIRNMDRYKEARRVLLENGGYIARALYGWFCCFRIK